MEEQLRKELADCNRRIALTSGSRERALEQNFYEEVQINARITKENDELKSQVKQYSDYLTQISPKYNEAVTETQKLMRIINYHGQTIQNQTLRIQQLEQMIVERDNRIQQLEQMIVERDNRIEQLEIAASLG